jgi:hypothetical protein
MEATTPTHEIHYEEGITREDLTDEQFSVLVRIWTQQGSDVTVSKMGPPWENAIYAESGKYKNNGDGHVIDQYGLYHFPPSTGSKAEGIKPEDL